jgi:signal transduction histidine kinase
MFGRGDAVSSLKADQLGSSLDSLLQRLASSCQRGTGYKQYKWSYFHAGFLQKISEKHGLDIRINYPAGSSLR